MVGRDEIKRSLPAKESRRLIHDTEIARVFWMLFLKRKKAKAINQTKKEGLGPSFKNRKQNYCFWRKSEICS